MNTGTATDAHPTVFCRTIEEPTIGRISHPSNLETAQ
jgi:hypothetical protein